MSEKTLLVEIEKEQKQKIEEKFALEKEMKEEKEKEEALKEGKKINMFSSATFQKRNQELIKQRQQEDQELAKLESKVSQVIEKPNYDYIETLSDTEREKVFKIEREEEVKPKVKFGKMKYVVLSILFAIFGVWGIVTIAQLDSLNSNLAKVETVYQLNLSKYAKNLATLDATSTDNMEKLLPTIPDQKGDATEIEEQSNWFDRICNFIAGLFGG
ncbi:MAG: hypothetical protein IJX25_03385 [Clostridia bacterium]|nr:hypothetical protein [Clostridia bacterium]MBQ8792223.1 hypothetical protein [Clostridia bacterium]